MYHQTPNTKPLTNNQLHLLLFLSFLIIGCQQKAEVAVVHNFYTGVVDSIKVYPSSQSFAGEFLFDPVTGKDKIWSLNYSAPYELDLLTGKWTALSEKYHSRLKGTLYGDPIWKDSLTNDVFIINANEGLIHFPCDNSEIRFYPVQGAQCVLNTEDKILIGTTYGLYTIDKQNNRVMKVPGFPMDVWVNDIKVLNQDTVIINQGRMTFSIRLNKPSTMIHFTKDPGVVYNNPFIDMLPQSDEAKHYRLHYSGDIPFMYSSAKLFFQDSSKTTFEITNRPEGNLRHLKTDQAYIYLMYDSAFVILNKEVAMLHAKIFDIHAYSRDRERFNQMLNTLVSSPLDTFLLHYQKMSSDPFVTKSIEFSQRFESSVAGYFFYARQDEEIDKLEQALHKHSLPPNLEKFAIVRICMKYVRDGHLEKIPYYSNLLNEHYPDFNFYGSKSVLQCVLPIKTSLDSLKALNLVEDEYWYKEAGLKGKLVQCGWTGDTYIDFSIVNEVYNRIMKKYPKGPYADNAAFYIMNNRYHDGEEGDYYSPEQINAFKNFLSTYPDSELKPKVLLNIALNYNSFPGNLDSLLLMKKNALAELDKIDTAKIADTTFLNEIKYTREMIKSQIMERIFDFQLLSEKSEFRMGEEIKLTAVILNRTTETRQIRLYTTNPSCLTFVGRADQVTFIPTGTMKDTSTQLVSIMPNDTIMQEINLTKVARHWNESKTGRYEINQPGGYFIHISDPSKSISSDQLRIYIYE